MKNYITFFNEFQIKVCLKDYLFILLRVFRKPRTVILVAVATHTVDVAMSHPRKDSPQRTSPFDQTQMFKTKAIRDNPVG